MDRGRTVCCCVRQAHFCRRLDTTSRKGNALHPRAICSQLSFSSRTPVSLPHHNAFIKNLGILGIEANVRIVDAVQYRRRLDDFDFDIVVQRFGFSSTPGDTLRAFFTSRSASMRGTHNVGGIADPVIDALVESVIAANSRTDLLTACKALDRVIRSGRYWVPHWYKAAHWLAYWDSFG